MINNQDDANKDGDDGDDVDQIWSQRQFFHCALAHRYSIFLCFRDVEIYVDDSLIGQLRSWNI